MSLLDTFLFAFGILVFQVVLGIVLLAVFLRMRIVERDTRLPEETGQTPILEVTGGGRVDRLGWSMSPLCRLSLYENFLVAAVKSKRIAMPYSQIDSVDADADQPRGRPGVQIRGRLESAPAETIIRFRTKDNAALLDALERCIGETEH